MRPFVIAALSAAAAAFVAGCSTTPPAEEQKPAGVENREQGGGTKVPPVDVRRNVTGTGFEELKNPNSILSKRSIYYDFDRFDVKDEYRPLVEAHAKFLKEHPTAKMLIQGNTDERGSREYNIGLGQRRSDGVKNMLKLLGVKDEQMEAVSLGEEKPKAEGHDESAWAQNRRSDMLYNGEY